MKRNWKWKKYSMFLILALGFMISATAIWEAFAFTSGYEITTSSKTHKGTEINSLQFEVKQKKATSSASVKYGTGQWYIFKNQILAESAEKDDWTDPSNAFPVSTTRVNRTDPDSSGVFYDTMEMTASSFVSGLMRICNNRDELINGVTLYANRTLVKKNGSGAQTGGPYYNYTDFSKAASWSSGTLLSVRNGYNIPIYVQLSTAPFNVRYVELDADGNEVGEMNIPNGFVFGGIKDSKGTAINGSVIYGEALTFGAATYSGKDYVYKGYQWTSKADSSITAGSPSGFTMSNSYAPNGVLELTFYFQKKAEVTAPPFVTIPPEEGEEPPVTEAPAPPPVTEPPAAPPPAYDINQSYIRYYSTDAGNWLGKFAKSTSDKVASFGGVEGNGSLSSITKRTSSYLVGTDASGNKWYFYADGTNATYVHPHTYNGYVAESADVKYITELVFPSTITYNGTSYTVTHIGGGTDKYAADDSDYTSAGILYKSYSYSKHYSEDYYLYDQTTSSPQLYKYHYVKMKYGILGNGEITSNACDNTMYVSGGVITSQQNKSYNNSYIFYNTTLKSVTIPSTVKTIEMYAFQYCQALETINGGDGVTNIKFSAFLVDDKPKLSASNTWTDSGYQCYVYYYYNGDYSLSSPTSVMNAWQKSSILAPAMSFPYMKSLQTIGELAFAYHYNLSDVDLPATIATIGKDAFLDCTLDNIRIPNASCSIYDASGSTKYYTTLGSKGRVENPTAIHTVPDSTAMSYGLKYDGYYKLYCGYPVTYYPNGGTPNNPVEIYSALNINYLEGAEPREYANFTQSNSDSYSWYSEDYQYASYLDDDGVLYRIDLLNSRANVVSPGTTFTELVTVGSYNSAHYAWDSAGNLWFSGQYSMQSLDDEDDWYSRYSSMYDWRKVTLPAGAVDVRLDTWGVFVLDSSGYVWTVNPGSGSSRKINGNGDILFKKAYICTYNGDTDYGNDGMLIGITTEDKFVYVYEDYYGFDIDPYWSYNLTADNFKENTYMTSALKGYNITDIQKTRADRYIFFTDTGDMVLFNGSWVYSSNYNTVTGYNNITDMHYLGSYSNGGTFEVFEMKDASGVTYLGTIYGQSTPYCHMRSLGTGVSVKKAFIYSPLYGNSWATDDWNDTTTTSGYITVWTSDGYLTRYNTSSYASGAVKYASVKFKEIAYNYNNLYGLAEDGTLWSAGNNLYGQLGTSSSYDYEYPNSNDAMYLHSTGSRTYTDIYFSGSRWVIALGTDGNVYYAGEKPTTTYGGSYSDQKKYTFTALGSDYTWPASSTGTARRYIKGYDYDTEIATNLFAAPSGKQFKNWNTASGGTGTIYQPGDKVNLSAALTLYAQWETKPEQKKYVYFHANGGNGYMEPLVLAYSSSSATLPDCTFTRNNYKLKSPCWNTKADGTGTSYANGAAITLTQNATHLYAQWYQDSTTVIKYNLVYMKYPYGTTNNTAWKSKTLAYETSETIEGAPTSPSGTFTVTYSLNKVSSMSTTPTMDTLTAANTTTTASAFEYWEMYRVIDGKLTSVHNRYSPNDVVKGLSQVTGDTIYMYPVQSAANASVLLPMADCDGYVFKGWSETAAGNEKIYPVYGEESEEVSTFTPVKNTTLYAVWEPETYNIALDGQSATTHTQTSVTMTFDAMCPSVTVPSRTRYIFMGYFTGTNGAGTQYYDKDGNGLLKWQISNGSVTKLYAYWVPDKAINYEPNGGTGTMETTWIDVDKTSATLSTCTFTPPTGYHFGYWCQTGASCSGSSASGHIHYNDGAVATNITTRVTMYAQWEPNTYTLTLNYNGGTKGSGDTSPYTVTYNSGNFNDLSFCLPTRTGYTFAGWYTAASGGTKVYNANGTCTNDGTYWSGSLWRYLGNLTLYAQWTANTYTVTLDPDGGQPTPAPTVKPTYDANMPSVNVPTRKYTVTFNANTGTCATTSLTSTYIFGGYFTGKNGTGTQYYKTDGTSARTWNIAQNTTLYAKWTSVSVTLPTPSRTGYTFKGWYTAASGGTKIGVAKDAYTSTADITLYAQWTANTYTVPLDNDGGKPTPAPIVKPTYDGDMPAVTPPARAYTVTFNAYNGTCSTTSLTATYIFGGYFTGKNGTGTQYYKADGTSARTWNIAQNTTLYAKWTSDSVTLPTPTKLGYTFQGWYTASSGGTKIGVAGDAYTPTADITLYAQWKANVYNLSYDLAGNKTTASTTPQIGTTPPSTATYDKSFTVVNPTRTGYTFLGWNISGMSNTCTHYYGSKTTTATTLSNVTETTFKNLHSVSDSTVKFAAQWQNNTYTVTLDLNATGADPAATITYNSFKIDFDTAGHMYGGSTKTDYLKSNAPTRIGYTFTGWYTATSGGTKVYNADGSVTKEGTYFDADCEWVYPNNVTLYAQWIPNNYNITINGNKGTGSSEVTVPYSAVRLTFDSTNHYYNGADHSNYLAGNLASRPGYTFQGYYTAASGGIQLYTSAGAVANSGTITYSGHESGYYFYQNKYKYASGMTIYAQWKPVTYTVTLNLNDTGAIPVAQIPYGSFTIVFDTSGHTYGGSTKTDYLSSDLPSRVGYTFDGWYTAASGGTKVYNADGTITKEGTYFDSTGRYVHPGNVTLYAHWTANNYTLTLEGNKGTGSTEVTVPYNKVTMTYDSTAHYYNNASHSDYLAGNLAYRTGYILQGYYNSASGGTKIYNADGTLAAQTIADSAKTASASGYYFHTGVWKVANDVTLYSQWKAKEYDITLNDRGATSSNHTEIVHLTFDKKGADIVVPTKTGYTFHGYYTGTRGSGTQYYDASGVGVKEWTEDDKTQIYAYWIQDKVILPDVGDRTEPTPLPELDSEGSVGRTDAKGLLYADDYNAATGALTDLQPYLTYNTAASEGAIPGTEEIAFRAKIGSWMLHYKLHRNTGTDYVRFYVTVPYRTQYEQSADEELVISAQQTKTFTFVVPKVWSYWEILESGMYYPDKVTVTNNAMKNTTMEVAVDRTGGFATVPPAYDVEQYGDKTNHVFWDEYDTDDYPILRITLTDEQYIISDVLDTPPNIDPHLTIVTGNAAWEDERQADVKSDRYVFDKWVVLADDLHNDGRGASPDEEVVRAAETADWIEETSYLQTYISGVELEETAPNGVYTTGAVITYVGDNKNVNAPMEHQVPLNNINSLVIHTPVVSNGRITEGMETEGEKHILTLKNALNFFSLVIENTGTHRMSFGYGTKDFSLALSGKSNVAIQDGAYLNQVQFPFDVYVDAGNDSKGEDGSCNPQGDYLLAAGTWLTIGREEQQFYVPVTMKNGEYRIKFRTIAVNCPVDGNGGYLVSEEQNQANLSPSCYVAADQLEVEVKSFLRDFRITSVNSAVAAEQLDGGCQALTLKKGYGFFFELLTQGEFYGENAKLSIVPEYWWESSDGTVRKKVTLYRLGELVQDVERSCHAWENEPVLLQHENYDVILQSFTGNGMLPADVLCVDKDFLLEEYAKQNTFTGREEFFLQEGYLVIRFDILVQSNEGVTYVFDRWADTELAADAEQEGWNYIPGDIIRYDLAKSISEDYEIGGSE